MAFQAVGESLVYCSSMWFIMAFLTFRNLTVGGMAGCTLQFRVFGVVGLQIVIDLRMTGSTDVIGRFFRIR